MKYEITEQWFSVNFPSYFIRKVKGFITIVVAGFVVCSNSQAGALFPEASQPVYRSSHAIAVWRTANPGMRNGDISRFKGARDPFAPLKKSTPAPKSSPPPKHSPSPPAHVSLPGKLLSVVHGPWGFQAVIQLSPKEYLVVEPGELIAHSGWRVKGIQEDGVRLERVSSASSSGGPGQIISAMLFFD